MPGYSPKLDDYDDAWVSVGTLRSSTPGGRSLIINGHIDVVPEGPHDMWSTPPFEPVVKDGWMHGRGAGDMKAGWVCGLFALDAIRLAGFRPASDSCQLLREGRHRGCREEGERPAVREGALGAQQPDAVLAAETFSKALQQCRIVDRQNLAVGKFDIDHESLMTGIEGRETRRLCHASARLGGSDAATGPRNRGRRSSMRRCSRAVSQENPGLA